MKRFLTVDDIGDLDKALKEAAKVKKHPYKWHDLGKNKTIILVFFNSSLRTRLSSQKAAQNLGMNVMVLNIDKDSWKLETEMGVVMDGDKSEHLREAIPVIGSYCDISLESATRHPCQAFADLITIEEHKTVERPKVVLTWAPHPKALPQAVPNSFAEWMKKANVDFVITCPEGYDLAPDIMEGAHLERDQRKAFEGADFIYAKNWSSYESYGQILSKDMSWTVDAEHMAWTNNAKFLHCLPVRRNMIVTDEVIDSPNSLVIPEAANRVVSAQVVMKRMLEDLEKEGK